MYKRFFAFGCSYTKYIWPTWADIIAEDLKIEYHNYGRAGLGNVGIQCEIIRADIDHNFNSDDLIIIMWSSWNREDRFIFNDWRAVGNIFTNDFYDDSFIKKYWSFENDIIKNSTAIISINKAFQNLISFQSNILPPGEFESKKYQLGRIQPELFGWYNPFLPKEVFNTKEAYQCDRHPSISSYLDYVEDKIYPSLGLNLKKETISLYKNIDLEIKKIDQTRDKNENKIYKIKNYLGIEQ
jgi:hypothetical protein